jgi:ABC-2 type transport system ATP-binding protein
MEEIEKLCDRVAVIDHGRVVALDTPAALMRQDREGRQILFTADDAVDRSRLEGLPDVSSVTSEGREFTVTGSGYLMAEIAAELSRQNINPPDLRTQGDTMEAVFMRLTGEHTRD